jgi:DNA repair protein RecO (recombination protein O)
VPLTTTRSLILQSFPYSETSKVLRLLTLDHGLRSVIAKGALRPKSRYGGILEPFTEGNATFYLREGRELFTLSGFELVRSRQGLGRSLAAFAGASLLAELAMRLSTEEPHPEVHHALRDAWDALQDAAEPLDALGRTVAGAWTLVSLLGFAPQTDHCVSCGRELAPDEPTRFDAAAGGAACTACRPAGRIVDPDSRRELGRFSGGGVPEGWEPRAGMHRALLRVFLMAHFAQDRPFRSLDLFLENTPGGPGTAG